MTASWKTVVAVVLAAGGMAATPMTARAELPPGHEVDEQAVCLTCHELEGLEAKVQHFPAEAGDCSACHNPHVSRFDSLLRERPASVCNSCHENIAEAMDRRYVHEPVADGRCVDCHEPHGSANAGLLVRPAKDLCSDCHEDLVEWSDRAVQHPPFDAGSCADCHDPHAADHPGLAAKAGGGMCTGCHPVTAVFKQKHNGYPVERARCNQCHEPHASTQAGLFRSTLHAPFESGECTTCHASANAADPFALVERQDRLCGECHAEQVEQSRSAPVPHVSAGGASCTECHNPHSGDGTGLLKEDLQSLCLSCHDPGGSRSGQEGRFRTHADQDCTVCHAPHGGSEPLLFAADSVKLCSQCHAHEHGIVHPLGEDARDPRSGAPMTCLSCHGMHDAPYDLYMHESVERELCLGCHKDIGGGS